MYIFICTYRYYKYIYIYTLKSKLKQNVPIYSLEQELRLQAKLSQGTFITEVDRLMLAGAGGGYDPNDESSSDEEKDKSRSDDLNHYSGKCQVIRMCGSCSKSNLPVSCAAYNNIIGKIYNLNIVFMRARSSFTALTKLT